MTSKTANPSVTALDKSAAQEPAPRRIRPNRRLLTILVGSNLYESQDACVRELVQNAWDAIQLRKEIGDGKGGVIEVRFSTREGWFEVADDGLGMDMHAIEKGFLEAGQDKRAIFDHEVTATQIGHFGIGVLSVFLVAKKIAVTTKHNDPLSKVIRFELTGIEEEVTFDGGIDTDSAAVGTTVRAYPREDVSFDVASIPTIVSNYARHVQGVVVVSVDDGTRTEVGHTWTTDGHERVSNLVNASGLTSGRIAMSPVLSSTTGTISSEITICNAGFLVEANAADLMPLPAIGVIGEVDVLPGSLTMGLSRERIQRDELWCSLGVSLQEEFLRIAIGELKSGYLCRTDGLDSDEVKRNLLLWYHYLPKSEPFLNLYSLIETRLYESVPFQVADRSPSSLEALCTANCKRRLFYREIGKGQQTVERIDDEGLPIRVSQEVRDSIRVGALRANGFDVVELGSFQVSARGSESIETHQIFESALVRRCLESQSLELKNITEADESEMDLRSIERLPVLNDALAIGSGLRFANVTDSTRRVITDSLGTKYINLRNSDIQKILHTIPRAIANPLRRKLLEAYLMVENFQLRDARDMLTELLMDDDLESLANAETAIFTKERIEQLISELLAEL